MFITFKELNLEAQNRIQTTLGAAVDDDAVLEVNPFVEWDMPGKWKASRWDNGISKYTEQSEESAS